MPGSSNGNTSGPINESFSDGDFEFENVRPNRTPHLRAMTRAELAGPVHHSFLDHPKPPKDVTNRAIYALHHAIEKEVDYQKIRQNGRDDQTFGYILDRQIRHWLLLLKLKNTDYVVDLGSGYGNIVAFVAALAPQVRRVVGIENSQVCIDVMHKFLKEFEKLYLEHTSLKMARTYMHGGSFLDEDQEKHFMRATVIFINNEKFGSELMRALVARIFNSVTHGTKIITAQPLGKMKMGEAINGNGQRVFTKIAFKKAVLRNVPEALFDMRCIPVVKGQNVNWKKGTHTWYENIVNWNKAQAFDSLFQDDKKVQVKEEEVMDMMKKMSEET